MIGCGSVGRKGINHNAVFREFRCQAPLVWGGPGIVRFGGVKFWCGLDCCGGGCQNGEVEAAAGACFWWGIPGLCGFLCERCLQETSLLRSVF